MSANELVLTHLKAAKAELLQERMRVDAAIHRLDAIIAEYARNSGTTVQMVDVPPQLRQSSSATPPMKDAILALLQERGQVKAGEAAELLAAKYDWSPSSVRSQLAKMARDGLIHNQFRGHYSLEPSEIEEITVPGFSVPRDTETPAAAGASEGNIPTSLEGGGDSHGPTYPTQGDRDDNDHLGASIAEVASR